MITLTEKIRAGLSAVPAGEFISAVELRQAIGVSSLAPAIKGMVKRGEVISTGRGRGTEYRANPDFKAADGAAPTPRRPRKKAAKRKQRAVRSKRRVTLKQIARKHRDAAVPEADRAKALVIINLVATGRELVQTLEAQVEGIEANPALAAAVAAHKRASDLYEAV